MKEQLYEDFLSLAQKYEKEPVQEFGASLISFTTKLLLDLAPRHSMAHDLIRKAIDEGIKWHVEGRQKGGHHE